MEVRVITLRYSEGVQGFPEDALRKVCAGREILEVTEHFFVYGNVPHLALVVKLGEGAAESGSWRERSKETPDLELELSEERRPLYRALKKWRNDRAKAEGKPAYAIGRNTLILEITKALPKTMVELKAVSGMGEASVAAYGKEILEIVANVPIRSDRINEQEPSA